MLQLTFKPVHVPRVLLNKLDIIYRDNDKTNLCPSNIIWKFPKDGLRHPDFPEFAIIPGFTRYAISKEGEMVNHLTGKPKLFHKAPTEYYQAGLTWDIGPYLNYPRHRLLALAWLEYETDVTKLDVNHKNGIKGDDRLENLEWSTRKENCDHAYQTGLRDDVVPVLVKDLRTGVIKEFCSCNSCSIELSVSSGTVANRIKTRGQVVFKGGLLFKRKDDPTPWAVFDDVEKTISDTETKYGKKIIVRNIFTNKTAVFNSIALAASFANVCNEKVADFIDRKPNCIPTNGFDYKLDGSLEPFKEWSDLQKRQIKIFNGNPPSSYVVHDLLTNDKVFFHCGSDAARFFNIELDTFRFYGRPNKDRLFRNRYKFIQVLFHQLPSIEGSVKVLSVGNNGTEPLELLETPEECHATA